MRKHNLLPAVFFTLSLALLSSAASAGMERIDVPEGSRIYGSADYRSYLEANQEGLGFLAPPSTSSIDRVPGTWHRRDSEVGIALTAGATSDRAPSTWNGQEESDVTE